MQIRKIRNNNSKLRRIKYEWRVVSNAAFGPGASRRYHNIFIYQGFEKQKTRSLNIETYVCASLSFRQPDERLCLFVVKIIYNDWHVRYDVFVIIVGMACTVFIKRLGL